MLFGTGLRRKEALSAEWSWIDWDRRSITVPAAVAKDREEREIGLGGRLYQELWARNQEEGYILPRWYPTTVTKAIRQHFKLCGFDIRLHDTRHTYASLIQLEAGAMPAQAMQRTGHSNLAMLSHYTHTAFSEVLEDRLPFMKPDEEPTKH